jgi:hypothetical protein
MKRLFKVSGTSAMLAVLLLSFAACEDLLGSLPKGNPTADTDTYMPVVYTSYDADGTKYELTITRTSKAAVQFTSAIGDSYTLTITTAAGVTQTSTGQITYISGATFTLKHTGTDGTFIVTVSANSPSGGTMVSITGDIPINNSTTKAPAPATLTSQPQSQNQTPKAEDYEIGNLTQTVGIVTAVTITPKSGKSGGERTIYYEGTSGTAYAKSATPPTTATAPGTYAVTFDVAAATGWNPATGLSAGNLVLNTNPTPVAGDYDIGNMVQSVGSVTAVTITPKSGKSSGERTIYYEGTSGTAYAKSATPPTTATAAETYAVTFDVAAATGWNPATGLSAGNLVLNTNPTPVAGDYDISGLGSFIWDVGDREVTITPKTGKSGGARTIYYESATYEKTSNPPSGVGTYTVTFDVAAVTGWNAATNLSAGALSITKRTLKAGDFSVSNLNQTVDDIKGVEINFSITQDDREGGWGFGFGSGYSPFTIYYAGTGSTSYAKSVTPPKAAGTYAVTFDVAAGNNWNAATNLSAGTLTISGGVIPVEIEYNNYSGRPDNAVEAIAREIEEAYKININGCKDAIGSYPWRVDFGDEDEYRGAKIIEGKLRIKFSLDYYDGFDKVDRAKRLDQIGMELKLRADNAELISKYYGNSEDIRMAKLAKPQPWEDQA